MGGDSIKDQIRILNDGVDIVTGTPGRLDDLISTGKLDVSGVSIDRVDGFKVISFRFVSLYLMKL